MQHLVVRMKDAGTSEIVDATLSSMGSDRIGIIPSGGTNPEWILQSDGTNVTYTLTDTTSSHGHYVYSMEWV